MDKLNIASEIDWNIIERLTRAFPRGFINSKCEFVAHKTGEYFMLRNCETELDVKSKVLEYFSRGAYKSKPYRNKAKNEEFHAFMLNGINQFLGTHFTLEDMAYIYSYLGNGIRHNKTIEFIAKAHYNMGFFRQFEKGGAK